MADTYSTHPLKQAGGVTRRQGLGMLGGLIVAPALGLPGRGNAAGVNTATVLYQGAFDGASAPTDPDAQAAVGQLAQALSRAGMVVQRPTPEVVAAMANMPLAAIEFEPGSGAVVVLSASHTTFRNGDHLRVEVRLAAQVFIGNTVLLSGDEASARDWRIAFGATPDSVRIARTEAAQRAAKALAAQVMEAINALSAEALAARLRPRLPVVVAGQLVAAPPGLADVQAPAGQQSLPAPRKRHALLVGVSDFSRVRQASAGRLGVKDLDGVRTDLQTMQTTLSQRGFAPQDVTVLANQQATSSSVRGWLMTMAGKVQPDDLVFVFFASHGAPANASMSGYGLPVLDDFRLDDPNTLDFWQVQALIGGLPAHQLVLVVDTCHSGGAALRLPRLTVQAGAPPRLRTGTVTPEPEKLAADMARLGKHMAIVAAAQPEQSSLEAKPNGGLFTYNFARSLRDAAGRETLGSVFTQRVYPAVTQEAKKLCSGDPNCVPQIPVFGHSGSGQAIVV